MDVEVRLSREMRLIDVTMIGVGAMIGAGIFVLTGIAAGVAGPALILVFFLNGLVALLTAAAYAELGSAVHGAGGGYLWIKQSLPDPSGFLSGWMDWFAHAVACSLYAVGFGAYLREVLMVAGLPEWHPPFGTAEIWFAVAACALFAFINIRGASETGKAGSVVTIGKVVIIGGFIATGLWAMAQRSGWQGAFSPFMTEGMGGVFAAMGLTFIAFEGYEIIAQTSEEVEDPKRNIPRAVFLSLLIVVPIYMLVALVAVAAVVPPAGMAVTDYLAAEKEVALVKAANQFMVGGGVIILVGGLLSTISALNATIYSSSRVAFAMARDASLPASMARVHQKNLTPHYAIVVSAAIIVGMAVALPIEQIAAAASVMFLLLFGAVNVALIRLRALHPELDRGFKVPFVPFTPILAIVAMLFIAVIMFVDYPLAWAAAGGWIVLGVGFYYGYSRKRETAFGERTAWMERIERHEYRVLTAIYHPDAVETLMAASTALAEQYQGDVVAVSVVEVPEGDNLLTGRQQARDLKPVLDSALAAAEARQVGATSVVRLGRRISHALVQTAREEGCNFLVMGEPHRQTLIERLVSSSVERVLQDAPCQVGVVYGNIDPEHVKQILVPVTSGKNSRLALHLAPAFAARFNAPIRAVTVVDVSFTDAEAARHIEAARATIDAAAFDGELEILRRKDVSSALLRVMRKGTLVVIGAPTADSVLPLIGETVPAEIAHRGRNPVIVVRDVETHRARRFERLFFGRS